MTAPQHQRDVTVDETPTAGYPSQILGTHAKDGQENGNQPTENNDPGQAECIKDVMQNMDRNDHGHISNTQSESIHLPEPGPTNPRSEKLDLRYNLPDNGQNLVEN